MPEAPDRLQAEKDELNWLLTSGALGRSSNMARMLAYVCEKHFLGLDEQATEYSIATDALGRRDDFDSHEDTIVRVTAHSLRKRLQEIYQAEGVSRPVHIQIPMGNYLPSFIHIEADRIQEPEDATALDTSPSAQTSSDGDHPVATTRPMQTAWVLLIVASVVAIALISGYVIVSHRKAKQGSSETPQGASAGVQQPANTIRALMGSGRKSYVDRSGYTWTTGNFCTGGDIVSVPTQKIGGTEDPYLYLGGIRGIAHCIFPIKPGSYEIHFHFAETTELPTATRVTFISVNAGAAIPYDVVDNAGGDSVATSYVVTGIRPENDGAIHLDFTSEVSLLNAVEILPTESDNLLPVRFTASPFAITDSANQQWLSDRYFNGGRRGQVSDSAKTTNKGIYSNHRVGRFHYDIPVVPLKKYRVTLYFSEPWFGEHNLGSGGPGSRVFDVSCNGNMILKNFDILAEGGTNPVIKIFDNIQATAQGKIDLSFMPVVNYPLVNAIEVVAEPSR